MYENTKLASNCTSKWPNVLHDFYFWSFNIDIAHFEPEIMIYFLLYSEFKDCFDPCERKALEFTKILQDLEVLQKISAGDFVSSYLLLYQPVWGQEERHQPGQLPFKIIINV